MVLIDGQPKVLMNITIKELPSTQSHFDDIMYIVIVRRVSNEIVHFIMQNKPFRIIRHQIPHYMEMVRKYGELMDFTVIYIAEAHPFPNFDNMVRKHKSISDRIKVGVENVWMIMWLSVSKKLLLNGLFGENNQ